MKNVPEFRKINTAFDSTTMSNDIVEGMIGLP
jgi:hypothetical protein